MGYRRAAYYVAGFLLKVASTLELELPAMRWAAKMGWGFILGF